MEAAVNAGRAVGGLALTVAGCAFPGVACVAAIMLDVSLECNKMEESGALCATVRGRLQAILTMLEKMEKEGSLPAEGDVLERYTKLLERFLSILREHSQQNAVVRLIGSAKFYDDLRDVHDEIDILFKMLDLAHIESVATWEHQFDAAMRVQQAELTRIVNNTNALQEDFKTVAQQLEGMMTLLHATKQEKRHSKEQIQLMQNMLEHLVSQSTCKVDAAPAWYLPAHEIKYDRTQPFKSGSFGAVYRGTWGLGTQVVVKTLRPEIADDESARAAFVDEMHVWYSLNHPHVLKMYGACHVSTPPFIISEDAVHGSLDDFLHTSGSHKKLWQLLHQAALGLAYVHQHDIVHGDLKCSNILVGADGNARIADFGLSRVWSRTPVLAESRTPTGAVRWRAPECLRGDIATFSSDIYSLGMCIIESVTLMQPWVMMSDEDVRIAVVDRHALPERPVAMGDREWKLVEDMCAHEPLDRLSLTEVTKELSRLMKLVEASPAHIAMRPKRMNLYYASNKNLSDTETESTNKITHGEPHQDQGLQSESANQGAFSPKRRMNLFYRSPGDQEAVEFSGDEAQPTQQLISRCKLAKSPKARRFVDLSSCDTSSAMAPEMNQRHDGDHDENAGNNVSSRMISITQTRNPIAGCRE